MRDGFDELKDRLLRAGVRPGAVSRYVTELQEHLEDTTAELRLSGLSDREAQDRALARLGSLDALALPMLVDRRFHSLAGRAPWAVFAVGPILGCMAATILTTVALAAVTAPGWTPAWFGSAAAVAQYFIGGVLPVLGAWLLAVTAIRQRSRALWPFIGIATIIVLAVTIQLPASVPTATQPGEIAIGIALPSLFQLLAVIITAALPIILLPPSIRERLALR